MSSTLKINPLHHCPFSFSLSLSLARLFSLSRPPSQPTSATFILFLKTSTQFSEEKYYTAAARSNRSRKILFHSDLDLRRKLLAFTPLDYNRRKRILMFIQIQTAEERIQFLLTPSSSGKRRLLLNSLLAQPSADRHS